LATTKVSLATTKVPLAPTKVSLATTKRCKNTIMNKIINTNNKYYLL
jgi:hypothetical protein